jgi:4-hydroxybenzoyl-CoA thioesterase
MLVNRRKIQIEWGDCDPGGIVYFPRYLEYCDACTNALFARAGLSKPKMLKAYRIAGIPIVESRARFMLPSEYPDVITVASSISEWGRSSFTVNHKLYKDKSLAAEIFEKRVWVSRIAGERSRFKGEPIPAEVKARFATTRRKRIGRAAKSP